MLELCTIVQLLQFRISPIFSTFKELLHRKGTENANYKPRSLVQYMCSEDLVYSLDISERILETIWETLQWLHEPWEKILPFHMVSVDTELNKNNLNQFEVLR
jgi:hypothetical protein